MAELMLVLQVMEAGVAASWHAMVPGVPKMLGKLRVCCV
jgi:hypothetical protein